MASIFARRLVVVLSLLSTPLAGADSAIAAPRPNAPTIAPSTAPNKVISVIYLNELNGSQQAVRQPPVSATSGQRLGSTSTPILVPPPERPSRSPIVSGTGRWSQLAAVGTNVKPVQLWATYYYVHRAQSVTGGQPLLNLQGQRLGPTLSRRDWCYAALQGTVQVMNAGVPVTYNYAGRGSSEQVDCSSFFSSLSGSTLRALNRVRFSAVSAAYGLGTGGYQLVPFRTIAVDRNRIPLGSVVYIPAARGTLITLPSGEQVAHDGYFFAADVGGAIRGNHIDVFIGVADRNPFSFVTSKASGTFQAYLVNDPEIQAKLSALHRLR
jgi:3D (Asp-Asp-Asp) domain-containing protein